MRFTSLFLTLLCLLPLPDLEAAPASPEYRIEIVLFLRDANPSGEYWSSDTARPDSGKAVATLTGTGASASGLGSRLPPVAALPSSSYQLKAHAEALRRRGLTPLLHTAWHQPVGDRENPDWLWLDAGPINGLLRVSLGRYLHIDTDLALKTSATTTGLIHSIDHRRMRSGELHYLDHPGFGILAIIDAYQPASPSRGTAAEP